MSQQVKKKKSIPKPTLFGKNLKFLRRVNGLSQKELAEKLEINRNNIASYESGSAEPSAKVFLRISTFFSQRPSDMLDLLMVEQKIETTHIVVPTLNPLRQEQFEEVLGQISHQTNEMTKIYEGYTALVEMKNDNDEDIVSKELFSSFTDLLDLLKTLISLNWEFMHEIFPSDVKNQNSTKK